MTFHNSITNVEAMEFKEQSEISVYFSHVSPDPPIPDPNNHDVPASVLPDTGEQNDIWVTTIGIISLFSYMGIMVIYKKKEKSN